MSSDAIEPDSFNSQPTHGTWKLFTLGFISHHTLSIKTLLVWSAWTEWGSVCHKIFHILKLKMNLCLILMNLQYILENIVKSRPAKCFLSFKTLFLNHNAQIPQDNSQIKVYKQRASSLWLQHRFMGNSHGHHRALSLPTCAWAFRVWVTCSK